MLMRSILRSSVGIYAQPNGVKLRHKRVQLGAAQSCFLVDGSCRDLRRRIPMKLRALSSAPRAFACWLGIAGATQRNNGCARVLMFHGTPRNRARHFERVLRYLRRQFEVVSLGALADAIDSPTAPLKRKVVLTFDDGLRNNVEVAYPILQRLGPPAPPLLCPRRAGRAA